MASEASDTTPGREPDTTGKQTTSINDWTPIYPVYPKKLNHADHEIHNSLPIDWQCPCGSLLRGGKSCPKCGKVPLMRDRKLSDAQKRSSKRDASYWRKFAKGGRS